MSLVKCHGFASPFPILSDQQSEQIKHWLVIIKCPVIGNWMTLKAMSMVFFVVFFFEGEVNCLLKKACLLFNLFLLISRGVSDSIYHCLGAWGTSSIAHGAGHRTTAPHGKCRSVELNLSISGRFRWEGSVSMNFTLYGIHSENQDAKMGE